MIEETLQRGWENLIGRLDGPLHFRLIFQPLMSGLFAVRAGLRDAREGQPPFLWTVLTDAESRRNLIRQGWKDVGKIFTLALVFDAAYQVIVHSRIFPLELLLTATLLALVPYCILRGLVTRVTKGRTGT